MWKKGQSGNPKGRKCETLTLEDLRRAINLVSIEKRKPWIRHLVERSYENDQVALALLKKFMPDQQVTKVDIPFLDALAEAWQARKAMMSSEPKVIDVSPDSGLLGEPEESQDD